MLTNDCIVSVSSNKTHFTNTSTRLHDKQAYIRWWWLSVYWWWAVVLPSLIVFFIIKEDVSLINLSTGFLWISSYVRFAVRSTCLSLSILGGKETLIVELWDIQSGQGSRCIQFKKIRLASVPSFIWTEQKCCHISLLKSGGLIEVSPIGSSHNVQV